MIRVNQNNRKENSKRKEYEYRIGDKILIKNDWTSKYGKTPYLGPFEVVSINTRHNGMLRYRDGAVTDSVNIRNVTPYHE